MKKQNVKRHQFCNAKKKVVVQCVNEVNMAASHDLEEQLGLDRDASTIIRLTLT